MSDLNKTISKAYLKNIKSKLNEKELGPVERLFIKLNIVRHSRVVDLLEHNKVTLEDRLEQYRFYALTILKDCKELIDEKFWTRSWIQLNEEFFSHIFFLKNNCYVDKNSEIKYKQTCVKENLYDKLLKRLKLLRLNYVVCYLDHLAPYGISKHFDEHRELIIELYAHCREYLENNDDAIKFLLETDDYFQYLYHIKYNHSVIEDHVMHFSPTHNMIFPYVRKLSLG
jgi:hypothetical protein